jgi:hypothetical protein
MGAVLAFLAPAFATVRALARAVPAWVWVVAIVLCWGGWQRHRATAAAKELASQQQAAATAREAELQRQVKETARIAQAQGEVAEDAHAKLNTARADAGRAGSAAAGLRTRLAAAQAAAAASAAAPAGSCAPAIEAAAVSADLLSSAIDRARILALFADEAHTAGTACERSYEALRPAAGGG